MNCVAILLPLKWILVAADGFSGNVEACHKKNSWVLSLEFSHFIPFTLWSSL